MEQGKEMENVTEIKIWVRVDVTNHNSLTSKGD